MDEIKVAELLPGFIKVDDQNINPVYRGHIQPEQDDAPLLAYFKIIPHREVFVESVCSLLCRHLGLPTPEPYLLIMSKEVCPINGRHTIPAFATVDAQAPSFRQYLRQNPSNEQAIIAILKNGLNTFLRPPLMNSLVIRIVILVIFCLTVKASH